MNQEKKTNNTTKIVLVGLGVVALGTGGYFLVKHLSTKKNSSTGFDETTFVPEKVSSSQSKPSSHSSSSSSRKVFPLKKGSSGAYVKVVQNALIKKYGSKILPKYGADGHFGSELESALIQAGYPTTISITNFDKLKSSRTNSDGGRNRPTVVTGIKEIAKELHYGIYADSFSDTIKALKKIKSVNQYSKVSTLFKLVRIGGVRKTIVNALLTKFWSSSEKKKLNTVFSNIGLKYNGSKWSLSGLNGIANQIVTIKNCKVWNVFGESMMARKETILGEELSVGNGITEFSTIDDKILFVKTNCITKVV